MSRKQKIWPLLFAVILLGAVSWTVAWQEDEENNEKEAAAKENAARATKLERNLDRIQQLIRRAEEKEDKDRVRELRAEAEKLLDQLEKIERARKEDEPEPEEA